MVVGAPVVGATVAGASVVGASVVGASVVGASGLFLGNDLLAYLVLAIGGALLVGNGLALMRPPEQPVKGDLRRAPIGRTFVMMGVGAVAAIWALGSLLSR